MLQLWIVSFLWALSFSLIKGQLTDLPSSYVSMVRMLFALLVFIPFFRPTVISPSKQLKLFWIGMVQFGLMYVLYIEAFQYLQAHEIALFTITTPLFVTLLYDGFGKKFNAFSFWMVMICIVGSAVIKFGEITRMDFWWGFLLLQLANICFALGQVLYKKMFDQTAIDQKKAFVPMFFGAFVLTYGVTLSQQSVFEVQPTLHQWGVLAYLGVIATGICFFLWNLGATKVSAGALAIMNNMKIPLGVLVALVFFFETAHWGRLIVGTLLIGGALFFHEKRGQRPSRSL